MQDADATGDDSFDLFGNPTEDTSSPSEDPAPDISNPGDDASDSFMNDLELDSPGPASIDMQPFEPITTPDAEPFDDNYPFLDDAPLGAADQRAASSVQEDCRIELAKMKANGIDGIGLDIRVEGRAGQDVPYQCALSDEAFDPRSWAETTYMWKASALCHKPLYFEDGSLERYGHSLGPYVQPLASGAHFFATLAVLPYKVGLRMPNECVYALGHYRPGNCAPYLLNPIPFTARAALLQTGAMLGVAAALP